jgi:hypothetical protein
MGGWQDRHDAAIDAPKGFEVPIVAMLKGWALYAERHKAEYDSLIGDDGVLGSEWAEIGKALLGLLNGQLGRLDGGTLDGYIWNFAEKHGANLND